MVAGRILLNRWYNHLTIYSFLWTTCLLLYSLHLINYYEISQEAWFYIVVSWVMLFLSSFTVIIFFKTLHFPSNILQTTNGHIDYNSFNIGLLRKIIIVLSLLSAIGVVFTYLTMMRLIGGIENLFVLAVKLYSIRLTKDFEAPPYLTSLPIASACLAGIYIIVRRKIDFVAILPFLLLAAYTLIVMSRGEIIITGAIFFTTIFLTPHKRFIGNKIMPGILSIVILLAAVFTIISSVRHTTMYFKGETQEMQYIRNTMPFSPAIYYYLSAPPVGFSEYLRHEREKVPPGSYTFRSIFNVMAKFGLTETSPLHSSFVTTPELINTGTYLREIYTDFGPLGILLFPYALGALLSILAIKISQRPATKYIVLTAHLYAIIWLSWDANATRLGQWTVSLVTTLIIACFLDSRQKDL
ncbi:MAG: oligosaccharide repeat unit polymerase [Patescibacteria group bacterium]|nr:oligosaccharide repeat unit polymerase [Patescibacteria group bacterium]